MNVNNMLQFRVHDLRIHLHEIFYEVLNSTDGCKKTELANQFDRIDRMVSLYLCGIYAGWEDFDWKKATELGWLSRNDEILFKEFLL